jgi:hypothetical protein
MYARSFASATASAAVAFPVAAGWTFDGGDPFGSAATIESGDDFAGVIGRRRDMLFSL